MSKNKKVNSQKYKFTIADIITFSRLIFIALFTYLLFSGYSTILVLTVFALGALTDLFDGKVARGFNEVSDVGARMDQIFDRMFTGVAFFALLFYFENNNLNFMILPLILSVSREIIGIPGFIIAFLRGRDSYHVEEIGKITTFAQGIVFGAIIIQASWAIYLAVPLAVLGILAGLNYLKYALGKN